MRRTPYESAAAPTSHSATDPAEFDVVCRTKPNLPNQTDSNAALLPYVTHQLGSAHEWSSVWNGPELFVVAKSSAARKHKKVYIHIQTFFSAQNALKSSILTIE